MVIDSNAIDELKRQATTASDAPPTPVAAPTAAPDRSPPTVAAGTSLSPSHSPSTLRSSSALARVQTLRVPLIAQLAARKLTVARIRRLSIGTILEFERSMQDPLELLVNNRPIGHGTAVKIGEKFGLRIAEIRDAAARVRSIAAIASCDRPSAG